MVRLKGIYQEKVFPLLTKEFNYKNVWQVPRLEKIVLNIGLSQAKDDPKVIDSAVRDLSSISGQKPVVTLARKSISNFKIRKGMKIGATLTLRGDKMYEFFDRLLHIALPRIRDFRGVSTRSFDGRGNYTLGIKEQVIFPEIDEVDALRGMDITVVTTAKTDKEARALLELIGMPFAK